MKYSLLFFIFLSISHFLPAQKHDYIWVYGYGYRGQPIDTSQKGGGGMINFNTTPPTLTKEDLKLNFHYTAMSCADSSGRLLFYSNCARIFNHQYRLMENGDSINPGIFWKVNQAHCRMSQVIFLPVY